MPEKQPKPESAHRPGAPAVPVRRRRKAARPAEILDAALVEFSRHGFAGTRISAVAIRAGVSNATVHHYFDGKEELFRALFRSRLVDGLDQGPGIPPVGAGSAEALLRQALHLAFRRLAESDAMPLLRIMLVEADRFPDIAAACRDEILGKAKAALDAVIDAGVASGEFRDGAYRSNALMLLAPALFATLIAPPADGGWIDAAEAQISAYFDAIFGGIRA
jgi:AcrR family transcriptional regulator